MTTSNRNKDKRLVDHDQELKDVKFQIEELKRDSINKGLKIDDIVILGVCRIPKTKSIQN